MPRFGHGETIPLHALRTAAMARASRGPSGQEALRRVAEETQVFDFMFPDLQKRDEHLLPTSKGTVAALKSLGDAMGDPTGPLGTGDSGIPAVYTYFGQFVDHDITLESTSAMPITHDDLAPQSRDDIVANTRNERSSALDLDSVYGQGPTPDPMALVPYNGDKLVVGTVTALNKPGIPTGRPAGKDDFNDLPRQGRSTSPRDDRAARIGDHRNDENTIISQLHVAFLRAHNQLIDDGNSFEEARRILRQHYQFIVVHDYLKRVADPAIVDRILKKGTKIYKHNRDRFMPVEFSFAAFRFGHSMARNDYDFNTNFNTASGFAADFKQLFTFTALSGNFAIPLPEFPDGTDTLPENWIIEWEHLVDGAGPGGKARRIDTRLAKPGLFALQKVDGTPEDGIMQHLAKRNLLRGYLFRLPTGQAVARALQIAPLTEAEIQGAVAPDEIAMLRGAGFLNRTPLWYYILAEAAARQDGQRLGPVGSTIVAEVLISLVERSKDSILKGGPKFEPSLPSAQPGTFILSDLLRYAGVLQ